LSHLGQGRWGTVYAAVQISINRPVGLKLLSASRQHDETAKARFIADARAKAHVQHPAILSVYEAGESNGRIFYAHEYVDGQNLQELQASGQKIEESTALKILRVIGEGLAYFHAQNIPHSPLSPSKIYLGVDGQPRLANLATQFSEAYVSPESELQILGRAMLGVLPAAQNLSPGIRALLGRLVQSGPNAFATVAPMLQAVKALEPKVVPVEAAKISAQDRAAVAAVEAARKQQRKSFWLTVGSMAATFLLVAGVVYFYVFRSNERSLSQQVAIPAGQYLVGGKKVAVQPFWIDKYEVTIGQYAVFLKYLNENPTAEAEFNHPRQPRHIEHKSPNWEIYYLNAVAGRAAHQTPIDLNAPMLDVTWWSAYAYAKWRGRELPTEAEWEAAARGAEGFAYPWGNDYDPKKVNSGADHQPNDPGAKGTVDKYNFWSPVDKIKGDVSPFGVVGMGGNVSEWVDTWETLPDGRVVPVLKGGNFTSPEGEMRLDRRVTERDPSRGEEFIGFRTISRTPPQ
jgi:formylglycine-generating enzyme required for sulfatase activity/tRNA A-37 threonylcarbamoyl transferase component Bud32